MENCEKTLSLCQLNRLAACWTDLDQSAQERAIAMGFARRVDVTAECTDVESWRSDWRSGGGSWPCYTLEISVDGEIIGDVQGWHYVGHWSGRCDGTQLGWTTRDDDGADTGLPRCEDDDGTLTIRGGANLELPRVLDGAVLIYTQDEYEIDDILSDAAGDADHGSEPTLSDLDPDDASEIESRERYIIRDYRVVAAELRKIGDYHNGDDDDSEYLISGWIALIDGEQIGDVYEDCSDARAQLDGAAQDGTTHEKEADGIAALATLVDERLARIECLPGMSHGRDDDGLYTQPDDSDDDDEDDRYHLDEEQAARVCRLGWLSILDEVRDALGTRKTLEACRSWQEEMDAIVDERDPWVSLDDSVRGGNCPAGTKSFAAELAKALPASGEIGAARASVILAQRNDTFTRRACRMAAARYAEA